MAQFEGILCWGVAILLQPACLILMASSVKRREPSRARVMAAHGQLRSFSEALKNFKNDVHAYPANEVGLEALRNNPQLPSWRGPYLRSDVPRDPWNHPYIYRSRGAEMPEVVCFGADGRAGGTELNADLSNHDVLGPLRPTTPPLWKDLLSLLPISVGIVGFLGYPFFPAVLRRVNHYLAAR